MRIDIRHATSSDVHAIAACHVASWEWFYRDILPPEMIESRNLDVRTEQWAASVVDAARITLVATDDDGNVTGFASALLNHPSDRFDSYLQTLYLRKEAAGKKIGSRLLFTIADEVLKRGGLSMSLRVLRLNPARAFYERLGAEVVPEGIEQDAGTFDDVVYAFRDLRKLVQERDNPQPSASATE